MKCPPWCICGGYDPVAMRPRHPEYVGGFWTISLARSGGFLMLRQTAVVAARVIRKENGDPTDPHARGVVTLEQEGPGKGSFKLDLPAKECCNILDGAATLVISQKVQDGQAHA